MSEIKYLSVTQFANLHGIHRVRIWKLISEDRLPAIKIGSQWAIEAGTPMPIDRRLKNNISSVI